MSRGVNKVIIIGHLGADPDTRYMPSGKAVTNLRVATSEQWTDKEGDRQERTEWHSVVLFDKLGEIAAEYLRKGSQVYLEGKLQTRKWQDKEGKDRYTTEIIANNLTMLGGRGEGRSDEEERASRSGRPSPQQRARGEAPKGKGKQPARPTQGDDDPAEPEDFDDDIPFN